MKNKTPCSTSLTQRGFSLIEVLVSIVVLSFGVLGMVGMQLYALQANRDARLQSVGVRLAREAAELMRDNNSIAVKTTSANNPYLVNFSGTLPPTSAENCFLNSCTTPEKIAEYNIKEWLSRLATELPGARAVICYDSTPYTNKGIPQWACSDTGNSAVVKLGWTRTSTDRSATEGNAVDRASVPAIVIPATAGAGV